MKTALILGLVLLRFYCCGQTNTPPPALLFSCPPLQLRPITSETEQAESNPDQLQFQTFREPADEGLTFSARLSEPFEADGFRSWFERRTYERLDAAGYFDKPAVKSDSLFSRTVDATFTFEPIRIGKTTVSSSLYTALKRKNPLCLINPVFLNVSW